MIERFTGTDGQRNLVDALSRQPVFAGDRKLAERFAGKGKVVQYGKGDHLAKQGDSDNCVFFVLSGRVDVIVNKQVVATRESTILGEMAAADPTAPRSATLRACDSVVALKVSEPDFSAASEDSPQIWKRVAQTVGQRLRERAKFHLPPNDNPTMFVGSSVEGLGVVREIDAGLKHDPVVLRKWETRGVFGLSRYPLDDLLKQADSADFALFAFGPDDKVASRGTEHMAPRDNVILELGMFTGRLGRDRVFFVHEHGADLKIPTDLLGLTPLTYKLKGGGTLADAVGTVCDEIRKIVAEKGVVKDRMKVL